jgi:hypothetical protein
MTEKGIWIQIPSALPRGHQLLITAPINVPLFTKGEKKGEILNYGISG